MESSNEPEVPAPVLVQVADEDKPLIILEPVDDTAVCGPDGMCL